MSPASVISCMVNSDGTPHSLLDGCVLSSAPAVDVSLRVWLPPNVLGSVAAAAAALDAIHAAGALDGGAICLEAPLQTATAVVVHLDLVRSGSAPVMLRQFACLRAAHFFSS